jgi:16S rRNA (guanine527-N7)-methyltransferase
VAHAGAFVAAAGDPPASFLDLGSGAGIPGLVCALAWPDAEGVLVDARRARATFLEEAVARLGLEARIRVVGERAEVAGRDPALRGRFELVTARSFGAPPVTAECGAPFLSPGGRLIVSEPPGAPDARWPEDGLAQLGFRRDAARSFDEATVRVLTLETVCDDRWPRRDGVPAKRPLF